jgi:hypothetical protein
MTKRIWKNHMRDRETIRAGVWIIGIEDRVSSVLECVCSSLSLSSEKEGQTKQRSFCIQYETDRVERLLMRERQIVDNGAWIIMLRDRVSTLVEFMLVRLSLFRERETDRETVWIINMKNRVPSVSDQHQSFVFECQVFVMTQVCPVFQSRSRCQDFYIHRLPPLVSHSPPKTKKQIFYQFVRRLNAVFHRFVGRVVFKFMFFFYDTEGGTDDEKKKTGR